MKKRLVFATLIVFVLTLGLIMGCSKDDPVSSGGGGSNSVASIEVRTGVGQQSQLTGLEGDERSIQITAIAMNQEGVGLPGVKITFAIVDPATYKGTISIAQDDTATNADGQMIASYSVVLERSTDVVIEARSGQVTGSKTITLDVRDTIGNLTIESARNVLTVPPNETRSTTVTATLQDSDGLAIPGVEIAFSTRPPTIGLVEDAVGNTDSNGRVSRNFNSIVNQYGNCEVIATVNEQQAETTIEIRPVAGPDNIVMYADQPDMVVAEGSQATTTITAVVTDEDGVGVPNTYVLFRLEPMIDGGVIFGSLSAVDTTDSQGQITSVFNSRGLYGQQWVVAEVVPTGEELMGNPEGDGGQGVNLDGKKLQIRSGDAVIASMDEGELTTRIMITVTPLGDRPRSLTIYAIPDYFNLAPDSTGTSIIRASVRDVNGNGIPNLAVDYVTQIGTISMVTPTDSNGVSTAQYQVHPATDIPGDVDDAVIIPITASIPGTGWSQSVDITVVKSRTDRGTLELTSDKKFIYADGALTFATLTAVLKDEDGQVLIGRDIEFTSDFGIVSSPVSTDSLGRSITVFTDNGISSAPDSALVRAKYTPMGLEATVRIMIREQNPVTNISLVAAAQQMIAGSFDSTSVRATAYLLDGSTAPNGTQIHFETVYGAMAQEVVAVTGNFGAAETYYIAGSQVDVDTIRAYWQNPSTEEKVYSNEVLITLLSGPASQVSVSADPTVLYINNPGASSTITATVLDTAGNPVRAGTFVAFTTTLGTVTMSSTTDETGHAYATLTPGRESDVARVTATVAGPAGDISDECTVTFISGTPNTIVLTSDTTEIAVAETGGLSTTILRATVKDASGNKVDQATMVYFQLLNQPDPPAGCNINETFPLDSALTAAGTAQVSLNSGRQIGGVLIKAFTWRDSLRTDTVSVILATVAVVAGPPFQLDIDVNDDGQDAGGGAWVVEVSARVWDIHRNPVADRIPVVFTVNPEIATIDPGFTGNVGIAGAPTPGLAFSNMVYNSLNTFDLIEISAEVQTPEGIISGAREHELPMQEGNLELNVDPGNWMFEEGNEEARIRCWVVLKDGHEILINHGPILFTSNRARFSWYNFRRNDYEEFYPDPARKLTGIFDQENVEERGQATVYLIAEEPDIFLDPFTLEVTVQINASVEGYDDVSADPAFIFFTRHG